ncbi:ribosome maturation factor RimP [Nostocoides sp. HKS02]|uniref:ribosome maturation factor RimP n=1 Tax=Nostocoides sp. HKS02 TaxID=1813880 RepID=UPI0012B45AB4|nr:ribosome maturation factor RimP [Tetrasphaera sp. HKS02]QGN57767.1 ribosome maturation factor RimP [Tetrasphaera sp. HKS02]
MSVKDQIRPAVEAPLGDLGLLIEDVAVTPAGKRRLVRIWIDRAVPDGSDDSTTPTAPLSLDEVADATRVVSEALDEAEALGEQPYTLEVTSPGVDRPLTLPRHYRRNVGRLVTVTPTEGEPATGRIARAGHEGFTLEVPATKKTAATTVDFPYAAVARSQVQVEFSRPSDPTASETASDENFPEEN